MAERIGNQAPGFVLNIDMNLDVPRLLAVLATSEEHVKHVQAIEMLSTLLDAVARKAIEINNPELIDLMFKMKLITPVNNEGDNFNDI